MPRKVSGTTNDASKVVVIDETTWEVETTENITTGNYEAGGINSGNKIVFSRRNTDGEIVGYGNVPVIYNDVYGRSIENSAIFNDDDSDYLYRTLGSPSSNQKGIISVWLKRSNLGISTGIMGQWTDTDHFCNINFDTNGTISIYQEDGGVDTPNCYVYSTNQVLRDVTGWFHLCVSIDTTQATQSDRVKIWVNNVLVPLTFVVLGQNIALRIWYNGLSQELNSIAAVGTRRPYDGYMSEYIYLDGETHADPPSLFAEESYGIWVPKTTLSLTYGNNGFRLDFANSGNLGLDYSGNANTFTVGGSPDQSPDTPTNNFATMNPLAVGSSNIIFSKGNTKLVSPGAGWDNTLSTLEFDVESDSIYAEFRCIGNATSHMIGITNNPGEIGDSPTQLITHDGWWGWYSNGNKYSGGSSDGSYGSAVDGDDIIQVWIKDGKIWLGKNDTVFESGDPVAGTGPMYSGLTGPFIFAVGVEGTVSGEIHTNLGVPSFTTTSGYADDNGYGEFEYSPRTGFLALCSANMDDPDGAIDQSDRGCYVSARTGTADATKEINDVNFDVSAGALVVVKQTNAPASWIVSDTERGGDNQLYFDAANAETYNVSRISGFTSTGFTIGNHTVVNGAGNTYLDWVLRKGSSYGLDIVTYTGNGTSQSVNHNLGAVPTMMWVKNRDAAYDWRAYHILSNTTPQNYAGYLSTTHAFAADSGAWNNTAPTNTQFTVGGGVEVNRNGDDTIAYLFADIPGYCKAFSYVGNGSTNGPYIPLGFRPGLWFSKQVTTARSWNIKTTEFVGYNPENIQNYFDYSSGNDGPNNTFAVDACSEGLKIRGSSVEINQSGQLYIGFAWATQPGKWSNAR